MVVQVYRARQPKASPLWKCLSAHFDTFLATYEQRYQPRYGYLRPIIPEVVNKFMDCGNLEQRGTSGSNQSIKVNAFKHPDPMPRFNACPAVCLHFRLSSATFST